MRLNFEWTAFNRQARNSVSAKLRKNDLFRLPDAESCGEQAMAIAVGPCVGNRVFAMPWLPELC